MEDNRPITISLTFGTILKTIAVVLVILLAIELKNLILIVLTSVIIASSVERGTVALAKYKITRVWAVIFIYIGFFILVLGILSFLLPPLFNDLSTLSSSLPDKLNSLGQIDPSVDPLSSITGGLARSFSLNDVIVGIQKFILQTSDNIFHTASAVFGSVFSFILILVISFYLSVQEKGIENFLRIVTPLKQEKYVIDLWNRAQTKIGLWLQGQMLLGVIVGSMVFLGLTILGIKYALTLGVITAIFEIIPFFGPILSAVPGVLLGLAEGPGTGLMVLCLYVIVQQFENHIIYPLVVRKIIGVPPLIVILSLLVGAELAGFLGIIVSVPLATVVMELSNDIVKKKLVFKQNNSID